PIKDQSGTVKVPAGKAMSDEELLKIDWFVEGVDGTIK
ncbi:MAG: BMP family ABC transporter substrate-binding protein, partial [Negativicutes bacterium]|nr:BMP family ABC transporter substrate-binding protein [Negativicutes bacterium]